MQVGTSGDPLASSTWDKISRPVTTAYGGALVILVILASIILNILQIGSNYWLAWATPSSKDVKPVISGSTLMTVYASLGFGICFCTLVVHSLVVATGYETATILFKKMLQTIFHAPMSFFYATPAGRILNRCSTDQSAVETRIPSLLEGLISLTIELVGIIALMSTVAWEVLVIFIPLIFASILYQQYYMPASRELSRLSRVCEAPVIQYISETISGITTIRSFDQESRFQSTYMTIVDAYSRPEFQLAAAMKWLLLRLDAFSCITFCFLLVLSMYFRKSIDPGFGSTRTKDWWYYSSTCREAFPYQGIQTVPEQSSSLVDGQESLEEGAQRLGKESAAEEASTTVRDIQTAPKKSFKSW